MKKIVFITGTRADFGKLKPLIRAVEQHGDFEYSIFATGMHLLYRYGMTVEEIHKAGFTNIFAYMNQIHGEPMEMVLANTITGLSRYLHEYEPDLLVVHGDRVEAMAGATVGALRNILVGHVEGGELSGTIDDLIRHSVTKLAHLHFVANKDAESRLLQLGEQAESIHIIGSPDIDVMLSDDLPAIEKVKSYYEIPFDTFALVLYHSVTTEIGKVAVHAREMVDAILESKRNYVVIYPNNDTGSEYILNEYKRFHGRENIRIFPSLRFEFFLSLLKHAAFIIGNSSAGIHEAPVFGVPTINIGSRQQDRFTHTSIFHVEEKGAAILEAISRAVSAGKFPSCKHFGSGQSAESFIRVLEKTSLWDTPKQKIFQTLSVKTPEIV
jgi:UDP-N-acetylglucosamine 2-epimerase (hydrolysing)